MTPSLTLFLPACKKRSFVLLTFLPLQAQSKIPSYAASQCAD